MSSLTQIQGTSIPATGELTIRVEKPCTGVAIKANFYSTQLGVRSKLTNTTQNTALTMNARVTAYLQTKMGNQISIYRDVPLSAIAEYSQFGEAYIPVTRTNFTPTNAATMTTAQVDSVVFQVPFTAGGHIPFQNDETLVFTLTGLPTGAGSDLLLFFYALESPIQSPTCLVFEQLNIAQGVKEKSFNAREYDQILIPYNSAELSTQVRVNYTNGYTAIYTTDELLSLCCDRNDSVVRSNTLYDPFEIKGVAEYFVLDVKEAAEVVFNVSGTNAQIGFGVKSQVIGNPIAAIVNNSKLESASESVLEKKLSNASKNI